MPHKYEKTEYNKNVLIMFNKYISLSNLKKQAWANVSGFFVNFVMTIFLYKLMVEPNLIY